MFSRRPLTLLTIGSLVVAGCTPVARQTLAPSQTPTPRPLPATPVASTPTQAPTPTAAPPTPTSLSFAILGGGQPHIDQIVSEVSAFDEANPDITVSHTEYSWYKAPVPYPVIQQRYFGEHPDLVSGYLGGALRADEQAGKFLDLSDLWQELGLDSAVPPAVADMASVDGHRYWVPTVAQWNPIFYNTADFAAASLDPPTTWEGVLDSCSALRAAGVERPMAQAGVTGWPPPAARWFSTLDLALNGPDFHEQLANGQVAWTDPRVRAVFTQWSRLFKSCYGDPVLEKYPDHIRALASGSAAMDNLGEWIYESSPLRDQSPDPLDFFTIDPIDGTLPRTDITVVFGLAIPADSAHPEAARDLIRWLVRPEALDDAYQALHRLVMDTRVDPGYLPRHTKGLALIKNADRLIEVWEFLAPSPQANVGLNLFTSFLSDPAGLDGYLAAAEAARANAFGPATASGS